MRHERTKTIIFRQVLITAAESSNVWSPVHLHRSSVRCRLHSPPTHGKDASGSLALARFAASNEECCGSWQTARGCPEEINVDFRSLGDPIFPHLYMFRSNCSHAHGPRGSQMRASSARPGETDHVSFAIQARELQGQLLELIRHIAKKHSMFRTVIAEPAYDIDVAFKYCTYPFPRAMLRSTLQLSFVVPAAG